MIIAEFQQYFFGSTIFVCSLFLVMLVLVQRGRGGGLTGALGGAGGQSAFGTKAGDLFTRITIGVAAVWIFLCAAAVFFLRDRALPQTGVGDSNNSAVVGESEPGAKSTQTIPTPGGAAGASSGITDSPDSGGLSLSPSVDVPASEVPAAEVPAAEVPAAEVPAAEVPAANSGAAVPAAEEPESSQLDLSPPADAPASDEAPKTPPAQ